MPLFNPESLISTPTCFQSEKPGCTDLIVINKNIFFKNSKTFEVRISDHHHLDLTSMRSQYLQSKSKIKFYRNYKSFNFDSFNNDCSTNPSKVKNISTTLYLKILFYSPFMTKQLRKATIHRSSLKKVFNKRRTPKKWHNYKTQHNFCVNLLRKTKKENFEINNVKNINLNKKFWKRIRPLQINYKLMFLE